MPNDPEPVPATGGEDKIDQWFRSTDDSQRGIVVNARGEAVIVTYAVVDGMAMLEGDIELGTHEEAQEFRKKVIQGDIQPLAIGVLGEKFRWPDGIVPYEIADDLPNKHRVTAAIAHWKEKTPLKFPERTKETDYIRFQIGGGCSSPVGRQGGKQLIRLADGCLTGSVIHEIGHSVGLWHEQSRADRETFIEIKWENILEDRAFNFQQQISNGFDIGEYDYGSIMHYPRTAFSKNGEDTIIPKGGEQIGQRTGLSAKDIAGVKVLYPKLAWPA